MTGTELRLFSSEKCSLTCLKSSDICKVGISTLSHMKRYAEFWTSDREMEGLVHSIQQSTAEGCRTGGTAI